MPQKVSCGRSAQGLTPITGKSGWAGTEAGTVTIITKVL